jgi:hypothetical protein
MLEETRLPTVPVLPRFVPEVVELRVLQLLGARKQVRGGGFRSGTRHSYRLAGELAKAPPQASDQLDAVSGRVNP